MYTSGRQEQEGREEEDRLSFLKASLWRITGIKLQAVAAAAATAIEQPKLINFPSYVMQYLACVHMLCVSVCVCIEETCVVRRS